MKTLNKLKSIQNKTNKANVVLSLISIVMISTIGYNLTQRISSVENLLAQQDEGKIAEYFDRMLKEPVISIDDVSKIRMSPTPSNPFASPEISKPSVIRKAEQIPCPISKDKVAYMLMHSFDNGDTWEEYFNSCI